MVFRVCIILMIGCIKIGAANVVFTARGIMPTVFTPLNDDLSVNCAVIPEYAKYLADNGIKSVLVGGTAGQHMSLTVADRKKVIDAWVATKQTTKLHIEVQVGGAPLPDVINLAAYCQSAGVDSLLTLPELYFKPTTVDELVFYVGLVAKAAPKLPVLYYHFPDMTCVKINMPDFVKAATIQISNFRGIKFSSNDLSKAAQVKRALADGQEIFLAASSLIGPAVLVGIRSNIDPASNLFPRLVRSIRAAVVANDMSKATALQQKLSLATEAITAEGTEVSTMKAAMEIVTGIKVGPPSLPLRAISPEATERIETKLRALGLA